LIGLNTLEESDFSGSALIGRQDMWGCYIALDFVKMLDQSWDRSSLLYMPHCPVPSCWNSNQFKKTKTEEPTHLPLPTKINPGFIPCLLSFYIYLFISILLNILYIISWSRSCLLKYIILNINGNKWDENEEKNPSS
jgi:hypothetical protein